MRTDKEKVAKYEALMHRLQLYGEVCMDGAKVRRLVKNIYAWSYAHRSGNGMLTDEEQEARIDAAFDRLLDED
jgi:hypothetical protein